MARNEPTGLISNAENCARNIVMVRNATGLEQQQTSCRCCLYQNRILSWNRLGSECRACHRKLMLVWISSKLPLWNIKNAKRVSASIYFVWHYSTKRGPAAEKALGQGFDVCTSCCKYLTRVNSMGWPWLKFEGRLSYSTRVTCHRTWMGSSSLLV